MNRTQVAALGAAAGAMVAVAGCSSATHGDGVGPAFTDVAGLGAQILHGVAGTKDAQGTLHLDAGPLTQTSTFGEQLSAGKVTAIDDKVETTLQGNTTNVHVIYVDQKVYVDHGQNGKQWVIASTDSSDPVVSQLAETLPQTLAESGPQYYATMVSAAHDLKVIGGEKINGASAVHYHLIVDPRAVVQKVPEGQREQMQQAIDAGVDQIPMDIWVDAQGRPVKLTDSVEAQGQTAHVEFELNHFDENLQIKPPPADQIGQD
ncbi:MAG TPA: hypothetical protein VH373_13125 [Jatrophihabitantaceae bacterium]|jgi:hypothetical protein